MALTAALLFVLLLTFPPNVAWALGGTAAALLILDRQRP